MLEGLEVVAVSCLRSSELYCDISTLKGIAVEVLLIVNVNNTHNLMTTAEGYLLYHLTHLAVAD